MKEAWDNIDSGLKQWIITGVSIAVSFIPVVGPLISCIVDGTFVDMLTAVSSGDWAMLGMCCLAFVPGAKVMKGVEEGGRWIWDGAVSDTSFIQKIAALRYSLPSMNPILESLPLAFEDYSWQV